jgi:NAD(P)-dependent dehydrogenase (short-subunit alcohol dehydrogenase family)
LKGSSKNRVGGIDARADNVRDLAVVVTGGARGIGRAIVDGFTARGSHVAFCSRSREELETATADLSRRNPGRVFSALCDVRSMDAVKGFLDAACERHERIDVLIHNAGIGRFGPIATLSEADWRDVIDIDLTGTFFIFQEALARMRTNSTCPKGIVITIGSLSHRTYVQGNAAYASAKAAQRVLADYLFEESRADGIVATYLAIGSVNTTFSRRTPDTGWKIQPAEVADAVVRLAELAYTAPHLCLSYAELRVRRPLSVEGRKE